ncbi:hypothetical protein ACRAWF_12565 [Streptomyces sp. L7]
MRKISPTPQGSPESPSSPDRTLTPLVPGGPNDDPEPPQPSRRAAVLGGAALTALAVTAGTGTARANSSTAAAAWPTEFPLPNGWLPEGIAIGSRPYAYMGSRANGAIYRTDLRTGEGKVLSEGATGLVSVGLKLDHDGLLYVAGSTGARTSRRLPHRRDPDELSTHPHHRPLHQRHHPARRPRLVHRLPRRGALRRPPRPYGRGHRAAAHRRLGADARGEQRQRHRRHPRTATASSSSAAPPASSTTCP